MGHDDFIRIAVSFLLSGATAIACWLGFDL